MVRKKAWVFLNGCPAYMAIEQEHSIDVKSILDLCVHIIGNQHITNLKGRGVKAAHQTFNL